MYHINKTCTGCHVCRLACPMQAIHFNGSVCEIDEDGCVECGLCEKLCPAYSVHDTDDISAPQPHDRIFRECDLVVCGGGSGLVTAVRAGQLGKKVILLEKSGRVGGNMNLSKVFLPEYSRLHSELGLEDIRESAIAELNVRAGGIASEETIRTAVNGAAEFSDWLLEFPGIKSKVALEEPGGSSVSGPAMIPETDLARLIFGPPVRIENKLSKDPAIGPGWLGSLIKQTMLEAIPAQRLNVEILVEHEAVHLITGSAGEVKGVVAKDPGGETEIHCNAVVMATGGFGASDEKLQKYFGCSCIEGGLFRYTVPGNTGGAIDMLRELGVEPDPARMNISALGPAHVPFSYSLRRILDHPSALAVNLYGKRWTDESITITEKAVNIQGSPGEVSWGIFTQKNIDDIMQAYLGGLTPGDEYDCCAFYQEDLDNEECYIEPPVYRADSIRELAEKIGVNPVALEQTAADYNRFCQNSLDEEFGKSACDLIPLEQGPFYALYGQMYAARYAGGLMVDSKCRVLRNNNSVIRGLYACGDATSAMQRRGEPSVVPELTWALASAYRCAIEYVTDEEGSV